LRSLKWAATSRFKPLWFNALASCADSLLDKCPRGPTGRVLGGESGRFPTGASQAGTPPGPAGGGRGEEVADAAVKERRTAGRRPGPAIWPERAGNYKLIFLFP
jgi:hypothetical protein